jgi:hypothetical protein
MNRDHDFERNGEDAVLDLQMNRREFLELTGAGIFLFFTIGELPVFAQEGWSWEIPIFAPGTWGPSVP